MISRTSSIFIVDDDPVIRDSLSLLLRLQGFATQTFASGEEFLATYQPDCPGCLILDLRMPGISGIELQTDLAAKGITLPVIVITAHGDVASTRSALKAGAVDFIEKPINDKLLLQAITSALDLDQRTREQAIQRTDVMERLSQLTMRERQVLDFVVQGKHNREIAVALNISPRTVEVYKARMMDKLQVNRLPDLIRLVLNSRHSASVSDRSLR